VGDPEESREAAGEFLDCDRVRAVPFGTSLILSGLTRHCRAGLSYFAPSGLLRTSLPKLSDNTNPKSIIRGTQPRRVLPG
jgi:hypothetical protein